MAAPFVPDIVRGVLWGAKIVWNGVREVTDSSTGAVRDDVRIETSRRKASILENTVLDAYLRTRPARCRLDYRRRRRRYMNPGVTTSGATPSAIRCNHWDA